MADKSPLNFAPGIVKVNSPYAAKGRYIDCDKVRFLNGFPEKHLGYVTHAGPVVGVPRAMRAWDDFNGDRHLIVGTHLRLYHVDPDAELLNITPIRATGTVTDPFTTTDTSTTVSANINSHGLQVGDTVIFSNANTFAGIFIDGEYLVDAITDINNFTFTHSVAANASTTGGGLVTYELEITVGSTNATQGTGFGVGPYGAETYGTPRTISSYTQYARMWSLDLYGQNLLAMPSGLSLYEWDPNSPLDRAELVANSPSGQFMFVTNERYPVVLGAGGALMTLAWPDQEDITNWTPGVNSTANIRTLKDGSRLVAGTVLINTLSLIWSDTAVYSMQYTGARNIIYTTNKAAGQCGLIGPNAFVVVGGRAFWMGTFSFFMYSGGVQHIPKADEVEDWIYKRMSKYQNWKAFAHYAPQYNEITWFYVVDGDEEPTAYVAVCIDDWSWNVGTYDRTVMEEQSGINPLVFGADAEGTIYLHEVGSDADAEPLPYFIQSAPFDISDGNVLMDIFGYVPNTQRQTMDIDLTVKTYDYPQDTNDPEVIMDQQVEAIAERQTLVDLHVCGRLCSIRLSGDELGCDFRLGAQALEFQPSGSWR